MEAPGDRAVQPIEPQPFALSHRRVIMEPLRDDPSEAEGVTNPGGARGPDGELYLFPRLVAHGNYSRIGIARVQFDRSGEPVGIERLGIALEPTEPYEKNPFTGGGCEDARVTYVEPLKSYVMTYTAFSPLGPRIALAVSQDLMHWTRLGLIHFTSAGGINFDDVDNKDALIFPTLVDNPDTGQPALAIIHRPFLFAATRLAHTALLPGRPPRRPHSPHPSMWISYRDWPDTSGNLWTFDLHHRLLSPQNSWERVKIGGGTPPVSTEHGWLLLYHGVSGAEPPNHHLRYSAGALVLDADQPERIRYRSRQPILVPERTDIGPALARVVFPTAVDRRTDIGQPRRIDVYYGVADKTIGVGSLALPSRLEMTRPGAPSTDATEQTVGQKVAEA